MSYEDISKLCPGTTPQTHPHLGQLAGYAVSFYQDRVRPDKNTAPRQQKKICIADLRATLAELPENAEASEVQSLVYAAGKERYENLRDWFKCLYETMLGQEQGPRMGSFFAFMACQNHRFM